MALKPQTGSAGGAAHRHAFFLKPPQALYVSAVDGHRGLSRGGEIESSVCQASRHLAEHQPHHLTEVTVPVGSQMYEPESWRKSFKRFELHVCVSPEHPLFSHRPVDVDVDVHAVLRLHLVIRHLAPLQLPFPDQAGGGKIKGAVLTQLAVPVLAPRTLLRVQIQRLCFLTG